MPSATWTAYAEELTYLVGHLRDLTFSSLSRREGHQDALRAQAVNIAQVNLPHDQRPVKIVEANIMRRGLIVELTGIGHGVLLGLGAPPTREGDRYTGIFLPTMGGGSITMRDVQTWEGKVSNVLWTGEVWAMGWAPTLPSQPPAVSITEYVDGSRP